MNADVRMESEWDPRQSVTHTRLVRTVDEETTLDKCGSIVKGKRKEKNSDKMN